jgi:hypothetical protein
VTVAVPESEIRLSQSELEDIDPARLIVRLVNRLHSLESIQTKTSSDIERLKIEAARGAEDLAKPFPLSDQLADARIRVAQIEQQLEEAAKRTKRGDGGRLRSPRRTITVTPRTEPGPMGMWSLRRRTGHRRWLPSQVRGFQQASLWREKAGRPRWCACLRELVWALPDKELTSDLAQHATDESPKGHETILACCAP